MDEEDLARQQENTSACGHTQDSTCVSDYQGETEQRTVLPGDFMVFPSSDEESKEVLDDDFWIWRK